MVAVAVYHSGKTRSKIIAMAMCDGIRRCDDKPKLLHDRNYTAPTYPVAVFYGMAGKLKNIFEDYCRTGRRAVYVDLGYWGRHWGGRHAGYHKVSVNARHPVEYFQNRRHPPERFQKFRVPIKRFLRGEHILVAGMSDKGARFEGYAPNGWETEIVKKLRKVTDRPIVYRPKPSWRNAGTIRGTEHSSSMEPLEKALRKCHAVVTHHSNVAIDGLLAGVPAFCWDGLGLPMALQDLSKIEEPYYPQGRDQWAADIAWCQWSVKEMASGACWRYLKDEELVPCE